MQVRGPDGALYLCKVGKPEFNAPEIRDYRTQSRTPHGDDFALYRAIVG